MAEPLPSAEVLDADDGLFVAPTGDLENFQEVVTGLYRGARPTEAGIVRLNELGIKTIVNLENFPRRIRQGRRWALARGISYVSLRLNVFTPPTRKQLETFMRLVMDPANHPVYFHCMQGRDRTGLMAYVYRIRACGWSHEDAYGEMKRLGFHTYLLGLKSFVFFYGLRYARKTRATATY